MKSTAGVFFAVMWTAALVAPGIGDRLICTNIKNDNFWTNLKSNKQTIDRIDTIICRNKQWSRKFPTEIGLLTNLEKVDFGYNLLTGAIPTEIGQLTKLSFLHIGHNYLEGEFPKELKALTKLNDLDIFGNKNIGGCVPQQLRCRCNAVDNPNYFNCEFDSLDYCSGKRISCPRVTKETNAPTVPPVQGAPPTEKPTKEPTVFRCSDMGRIACNYLRNQKECMWTGAKCEDRRPTPYPTAKPTSFPTAFACENANTKRTCASFRYKKKCVYFQNECVERTAFPTRFPTAFSCGDFKKIPCNYPKNRKKCMWTGKECEERKPTQFPTKRPTGAPTELSCDNAKTKRVCFSLKYRKKCVFFQNKCVERTAYPTKEPTAFSCARFTRIQCGYKIHREKCMWTGKECEDRKPTQFPTKRPTGAPTELSCDNAKTKRVCYSLKYRKKCVFFQNECVERTSFPTRSPTPFDCGRLTRIQCGYKIHRDLCQYDAKARACEFRVTPAPTDAPTPFVECTKQKRENCLKIKGCKWLKMNVLFGNHCTQCTKEDKC